MHIYIYYCYILYMYDLQKVYQASAPPAASPRDHRPDSSCAPPRECSRPFWSKARGGHGIQPWPIEKP